MQMLIRLGILESTAENMTTWQKTNSEHHNSMSAHESMALWEPYRTSDVILRNTEAFVESLMNLDCRG